MIEQELYLDFDDVLLVPQYSDIASRSEVNLSSFVARDIELNVPILSAPMDTVTEGHLAFELGLAGGMGIIHRYCSIEFQVSHVMMAKTWTPNVGAAIGVKDDFLERAQELEKAGVNLLVIDVAHADHELVVNALRKLKRETGVPIMAGTIATVHAARLLAVNGVSALRVNVGAGSVCTTRLKTGFGVPQFTAVRKIAQAMEGLDIRICADGGIKNSGDIVKALAAGADTIMTGRLFAAAVESPKGNIYRGMASREAKLDAGIEGRNVEGEEIAVSPAGTVQQIIDDLTDGMRSGFSYCGARTIEELQNRAEFIRVNRIR